MDKTLILNSIKKKEKIKTNKDFAEFLGVKATTLAMWYKRNSFDIELIFKKCEYLNPEWLLTGQGSMLKTDNSSVSQNVSGDNVTMVGGFVRGSMDIANNKSNTTDRIKALKKELSVCKSEIKEFKKTIKQKDDIISDLTKYLTKSKSS